MLDPFSIVCVASIDLWQPFWFCMMKIFAQNKCMISVAISTVISLSNAYAVELLPLGNNKVELVPLT